MRKKIEEDKKAIALRDNQIAEAKKFLREPKKVMIRLCKKINNLENILKIFEKRYQDHLQQQKQEEFSRQKNYF